MLLFSTILEIDESLTKEKFINLVIEWNQKGHPDSVIEGIEWEESYNTCYGDDNKWLEIQEYRNQNIVAVRYEKRDEDGTVWDTDYIMNFNEMKMSIRLDRSYKDDAGDINARFYTPYFISLLIDRGYIKMDGDFKVQRYPLMIDESNLDILVHIVKGTATHKLPIILVSKTFSNEDPIDIASLTKLLKGIAHVVVQNDCRTSAKLRELCDGKNEYNGAVGLYYPNASVEYRRYLYRSSEGRSRILLDKIIRIVMQHNNAQMIEPLYTWYGVNNALLQDRLSSTKTKLEKQKIEIEKKMTLYEMEIEKASEKEILEAVQKEVKAQVDAFLVEFEEELREKDEEIKRLSKALEKKEQEVFYLSSKLESGIAVPVIVEGDEAEFYPGEIKDFVLSAVKKELDNIESESRRYDVLNDILKANEYQELGKKKAEKLKQLLSPYTGMTPKLKKEFEALGFRFDSSNHQKLKYYGDNRYTVVYGSTPSDKGRGGKNNASITIKKVF